MPSSLTPTRDYRDSPGANERESFFAILPLLSSQSITAPADHRFQAPPARHRQPINPVISRPSYPLAPLASSASFRFVCLGFVLFGGEKGDPINQSHQSIPHGIHSLPSNNKPKQDRPRHPEITKRLWAITSKF
jgi:hypothetical protein